MKLQILVIFLVGVVLASGAELSRANNSTSNVATRKFHRSWYGPSFRPRGWDPKMHTTTRNGDTHFGYTPPNGASTWPDKFAECGGDRQSPINIDAKELSSKLSRKPLSFDNYELYPYSLEVLNSGHSIHLSGEWEEGDEPSIRGGPLDGTYRFSQLHFHWGEDDNKGSEHTINHQRYPCEAHFVHALQGNVEADPWQDVPDDIAVIGVMCKLGKHNEALDPILKTCSRIGKEAESKMRIRGFPLGDLIKEFDSHYATYEGSLTTPPCSENVKWIVSSKSFELSRAQAQQLRTCIDLPFNFRPTQPKNERQLYYLTYAKRNGFE